ncbi:MAG TPA: hypothetical protein VLJ76_00190 [Gaiellaceae bacterium]|nr:hypothetical protein [Gaiellaceae bacterium]
MGQSRGAPTILLALAAAVVAVVLLVHVLHRGATGPAFYAARPALTPGALNPDVTQATIRSTICSRGWTKTVRPPASYTSPLKLVQMRRYGFTGGPVDYQEDHFISLELGGAPTDAKNLWPERRPRADRVDTIENQLNAEVCSGEISLAEGQRREATMKWTDG